MRRLNVSLAERSYPILIGAGRGWIGLEVVELWEFKIDV